MVNFKTVLFLLPLASFLLAYPVNTDAHNVSKSSIKLHNRDDIDHILFNRGQSSSKQKPEPKPKPTTQIEATLERGEKLEKLINKDRPVKGSGPFFVCI